MISGLPYLIAECELDLLKINLRREIQQYETELPIIEEKRSWGTSGSEKLDSYKERVSEGHYIGKPYLELRELTGLMDDQSQEYDKNAWSYLHKRYKKVENRFNNPSPRYLIMGVKSGFPNKNEKKNIRLWVKIQEIQEVLNETY